MKERLDAELNQIVRTATYAGRRDEFQHLAALLINVTNEETKCLEEVRSRLLIAAEVIPVDALVVTASARYQQLHDLSPQDALVYSSMLSHLKESRTDRSCFLNRNSKDFDDQNVLEELRGYHCKMLPRFDSGCRFILSELGLS